MSNQKILLAAAVMGIGLGATCENVAKAGDSKNSETVQCYGIAKKAGDNGCAIGKRDIEVANKFYKNKFNKSKTVDCAGSAECASKKGILSWKDKPNKKSCLSAGGFLLNYEPVLGTDGKPQKDADGKDVKKAFVEDKTGRHEIT